MKKFIFLLIIFGHSFVIDAKEREKDSAWVITDSAKLIAVKISVNDSKARLLVDNGDRVSIPLSKINSYSLYGRIFKKLPLYSNGHKTHNLVFMELIKVENGLNFYRYCDWSYNPNRKVTCFLVYKDDQLVLEFDEETHN